MKNLPVPAKIGIGIILVLFIIYNLIKLGLFG